MALYLERLSDKHFREVDDFECGIEYDSLANFLKNEAFHYNTTGEGNTYLIKSDVKNQIIAYYTLRSNSIQMENPEFEDKQLPDDDKRKYIVIPTIELSRFAVHMDYQNKKLGQNILLNYVLPHIFFIRKLIGVQAILVLSLDDKKTKHVYNKVGFEKMENKLQTLIEYENEKCVCMIIKFEEDNNNNEKILNLTKESYGINDIKKLIN
ncbi:hypothetical protein [Clostridium botulinum]